MTLNAIVFSPDPDTRVQTLEEKVTSLDEKLTDIESENETLKEEKIKTETEKEALLQQVQVKRKFILIKGNLGFFSLVWTSLNCLDLYVCT